MCYYKSEVQKLNELLDHYAASFEALIEEIDCVQEQFERLITKDAALKSTGMDQSQELGLQIVKYSEKGAMPLH